MVLKAVLNVLQDDNFIVKNANTELGLIKMKVLDNKGGVMKVTNVEDEAYYREFFAKVDKGVFIQKEKL